MRAPLFTNVDEYNQSIENRNKKTKKIERKIKVTITKSKIY
jgi:hypothetical protein